MKPTHDAGNPLEKLGRLVREVPDPEDRVPPQEVRVVRWAGPVFLLFSLILVPWTVVLGLTLPDHQESANYGAAWTGFDVLLLGTLASTGYFALRRSRHLSIPAAAAAALLVVDAWFDCLTTPWPQRVQSLVLCFLVELPLAAVCLSLSHHTLHITERRIVLLHGHRWPWRPRRRDPG